MFSILFAERFAGAADGGALAAVLGSCAGIRTCVAFALQVDGCTIRRLLSFGGAELMVARRSAVLQVEKARRCGGEDPAAVFAAGPGNRLGTRSDQFQLRRRW